MKRARHLADGLVSDNTPPPTGYAAGPSDNYTTTLRKIQAAYGQGAPPPPTADYNSTLKGLNNAYRQYRPMASKIQPVATPVTTTAAPMANGRLHGRRGF
ncbi:MAG: hypothetical protein ABSG41_08780 [Bryobacteraceae bacterium]